VIGGDERYGTGGADGAEISADQDIIQKFLQRKTG
jgi:hypothetical protein